MFSFYYLLFFLHKNVMTTNTNCCCWCINNDDTENIYNIKYNYILILKYMDDEESIIDIQITKTPILNKICIL